MLLVTKATAEDTGKICPSISISIVIMITIIIILMIFVQGTTLVNHPVVTLPQLLSMLLTVSPVVIVIVIVHVVELFLFWLHWIVNTGARQGDVGQVSGRKHCLHIRQINDDDDDQLFVFGQNVSFLSNLKQAIFPIFDIGLSTRMGWSKGGRVKREPGQVISKFGFP